MRTVIILFFDTPSLAKRIAEIDIILSNIAPLSKSIEIWLFYHDQKPDYFPDISYSLSSIRLIKVDNPHLPESFLTLLEQMTCKTPADLMLFTSDKSGAELATRIAYRLNGSSCLMVESVKIKHEKFEVTKSAYNNNLTATYTLDCKPYCISPAKVLCNSAKGVNKNPLILEQNRVTQLKPDWVKSFSIISNCRKSEIEDAKNILAVGSGVKNKNNIESLKSVAKTFGAMIGASRPVVMNAWVQMNNLLGISGKIISPSLCIVAGASGTRAFCVGIQNSKFIVAVNTDPNAEIFKIADIGIVDDLMPILTELENIINSARLKTANLSDYNRDSKKS